jgi:hypothetical protein
MVSGLKFSPYLMVSKNTGIVLFSKCQLSFIVNEQAF